MPRLLNSFKYAFNGITALFAHEANAKIHLSVAVCVIIAGFVFNIATWEWCAVILCIGGVFMAEGFNTAIEKLCDKVSPKHDPLIKIAKDVAAGAVLLYVFGAVFCGLIIFLPKVFKLLTF